MLENLPKPKTKLQSLIDEDFNKHLVYKEHHYNRRPSVNELFDMSLDDIERLSFFLARLSASLASHALERHQKNKRYKEARKLQDTPRALYHRKIMTVAFLVLKVSREQNCNIDEAIEQVSETESLSTNFIKRAVSTAAKNCKDYRGLDILRRLSAGQTMQQVADFYKLNKSSISRITKKHLAECAEEARLLDRKKERAERAALTLPLESRPSA